VFVRTGIPFEGYTDGQRKQVIDGYMATGDRGHFDAEGLLFIDGREDDMIISGGENVYPLEVENLLAQRDDVVEAAVIGVDDAEFGTRLRAFVVPTGEAARDPQEIKDFVRANLARYKVPRDVVFLDELPRNATGKLVRRLLPTGPLPEGG
jgi:fatty-acyl-CoA synthase